MKTATAPETTNNYADIKRRLAEPVPLELISQRQQGGATIDYVNVTDYKDLLDARAGIWEAFVTDFKQIGESLCCVVKLMIHADDGIYAQDGTGIEPLVTSSYGDPFSNAYAQALRRACEGHGLSRELWRGDHAPEKKNGHPNSPANPKNAQAPSSKFPPAARPATGKSTSEITMASNAQLGLLRQKAKLLGHDVDEIANRAFPDVAAISELSKVAAGWLISACETRLKEAV